MRAFLSAEFRKLWYMILADHRLKWIFQFGIVAEVLNVLMGSASYFLLTKIFQGEVSAVSMYGTDVVSYILVGMAFNSMLMRSLTGAYSSFVQAYFSRKLERVLMTPTSPFTMIFSYMLGGYANGVMETAIYISMGLILFNISLGSGNLPLAILVLLLGIISTIGLGLLFCQLFFLTGAGKGSSIMLLANTFTSTFSGATFPVEIIKRFVPWLYPISMILPQTHALSAVRLIMSGAGLADSTVQLHIAYMLSFSLLIIPIGVKLTNRGIDRIRREGYSPPSGARSSFSKYMRKRPTPNLLLIMMHCIFIGTLKKVLIIRYSTRPVSKPYTPNERLS